MSGPEMSDGIVIEFAFGLPGFEGYKAFVLVELEQFLPFKWLVSVKKPEVGFAVADPKTFLDSYSVTPSKIDLVDLGSSAESDLTVLVILTVSETGVTANLRAPLLIDLETRRGKQIVLSDNAYSVRHPVSELLDGESLRENVSNG